MEEETQKAYIDSNIFIYSVTSVEEEGRKSLAILEKISSGKLIGYTSVLTFDEVFWKLKKVLSLDKALEVTENMFKMLNLKFLDANMDIVMKAHGIIKQYKLAPRDSIHAATCLLNNIPVIISDDSDFDKLPFPKRKPI